jgi:hypothetical protein
MKRGEGCCEGLSGRSSRGRVEIRRERKKGGTAGYECRRGGMRESARWNVRVGEAIAKRDETRRYWTDRDLDETDGARRVLTETRKRHAF